MAVEYREQMIIMCLSTDTKPTTGISPGSLLSEITESGGPTEEERGKLYMYTGTSWAEIGRSIDVTTHYYVKVPADGGDDDNDGLDWGSAKATINAAMDLCSGRGRHAVHVAPGGYNENVRTPLNADAPFGQLIAENPTPGKSFGAAYIYGSAGHSLTLRARGWLVKGFEIGAVAGYGSVVIGGAEAGNNGGGALLEDCLISGWGVGEFGIDFQNGISSNAHVTLRRCFFDGFNNVGNTAACIICSNSGIDQPRYCLLEDCQFADSDNLIAMNPRGFKESRIHRCDFFAVGANYTPTLKLDNRGGNATIITDNYLGGTYSEAGGYYANAGGNDEWGGNRNGLTGGITAADPA